MGLLDFDSHIDQVREPTSMKVRGETFELPADIPMAYVIMAQGASEQDDPEEKREAMERNFYALICMLFGQEKLESWLADGMTREEYYRLVEMVCKHYFTRIETRDLQGEEEGDPKVPTSS